MNDKKQDLELGPHASVLLIAICGGAFWSKYGFALQVWFHNHLVEVVASSMALATLFGYFLVRRLTKKNAAEIERLKALTAAKAPSQSPNHYYQRDPNRGGRN